MNHAALQTHGPYAQVIAQFFWVFIVVAALVYIVVCGVLLYSLRRRRSADEAPADAVPPRVLRTIGVAVGLTGVILVLLALGDFFTNRALAAVPQDALRIKVTAHQWWWELEYLDVDSSRRIQTANHLVIPIDRPVILELGSDDVIHSFWVPSLNGKKDLLPGYVTRLALLASRAGDYQGECAEFCGHQHAHMSIDVTAASPADYSSWFNAQRAPAPEPQNDLQRRGRDVYLGSTCRACHAIQGTISAARLGPDLTHLASRPRIASGTLPNDATNLAAWILDPQSIKPGTRMPPTQMSADDLNALTAYLVSLR